MSDSTTNIPNDSRDITRDITQRDTSKNLMIKDKKSTIIVLKALDLNIKRIAERYKFPDFA